MSDDEAAVLTLHERFVLANTCEDVEWLELHTSENVSWFNLNRANYMSRDAICTLWRELYDAKPDKEKHATISVQWRQVTVQGDIGWVTYTMAVDYDFGDMAQFHAAARSTEIWVRNHEAESGWLLAHFHCSEHEPGVMGGV